ncbi:MAG: penicillin acylase family protein [Pseudomonadales bacterium]|nr:penicillin acylase family protein [Pseudomonadales bacterium]
MRRYLSGIDNWKPELFNWFKELSDETLSERMLMWLEKTKADLEEQTTWGDLQRQVQTPAIGMIPVIGDRFREATYPGDGSNDTLHKGGRQHGPVPQEILYGSSARHISDMSSLDENYFVLHGGQDGWLKGPNLTDQTQLWRQGKYIKIPLSMDKVKAQFNRHISVYEPE